jgi:hypothetical protein
MKTQEEMSSCTDPAREQVPTPCCRSARVPRHNPCPPVLDLRPYYGFLAKRGGPGGGQKGGEFLVSVDTHNAQVHLLIAFFYAHPPPFNQPLMYIGGGGKNPVFGPPSQKHHFQDFAKILEGTKIFKMNFKIFGNVMMQIYFLKLILKNKFAKI